MPPEPATPATSRAAATRPAPRVLILHANGSNRDHDAALACELAGAQPEIVHINQLRSGARRLLDYHMLVVPGGFSYGDDLGAGVLWAADMRRSQSGRGEPNPVGEDLARFVAEGRPVLGICNGFQALVKAGLLPGDTGDSRDVTLTYNAGGRFECRWVLLESNPASPSLFTRGLTEPMLCPVAHGEGRLAVRDEATAARLQADNLIALTYATLDGRPVDYPTNPNGSVLDIAALTNPAGNVMGLMPHPENHVFPWQYPRPGRERPRWSGLPLFLNGVKAC